MANELRFALLGAVEAWHGEKRLEVASRRQRGLLAVLLLQPGALVPTDRLIEAVWDDPPRSRKITVQSHLSRLRRCLDCLDGPRLRYREPGYILDADPDSIDVFRFRRLVDHARGTQEAEAAARRYAQALALWRGPSLCDVRTGWLDEHVCAGLEDERLIAIEERMDAELAAGHSHEVLLELEALVTEEPLRERLVGQLMLALHREGRQVEAQRLYYLTRSRLAQQLGLDPSPLLRRIHELTLAWEDQDGAGDGRHSPATHYATRPAAAPAHPHGIGGPVQRDGRGSERPAGVARDPATTWPIPAQLPADLGDFCGRGRQLADVIHVLGRRASAPPVLCLVGFAGVGKSALAVHAGQLVRASFPDGQLYTDLGGCTPEPAVPAAVLASFLRAYGVSVPGPMADPVECAALYRSTLADKCVLVVLDDARDAAQIRPLLPGTPGSAVLVTCRGSLAGLTSSRQVYVGPLPSREALALLSAVVGDGRVRAEPAAARQVVEACAGLPLAVRLAGQRLVDRPGWPVSALAGRLSDPGGRIDELRAGDTGLRETLQPTYRRLSERASQALRRLAEHSASDLDLDLDIDVASFAGRTGWPVPETERTLDELTALGLLGSPEPGRYRRSRLLALLASGSPSRATGAALTSPASEFTAGRGS